MTNYWTNSYDSVRATAFRAMSVDIVAPVSSISRPFSIHVDAAASDTM